MYFYFIPETSWKSNITFFGSKEPYHVHDLLHFWNPLQYERLLFFCSRSTTLHVFLRNVIFPNFIFTYFVRVKPILPQTNHTCNRIVVKLHSRLAFLIEWSYSQTCIRTHTHAYEYRYALIYVCIQQNKRPNEYCSVIFVGILNHAFVEINRSEQWGKRKHLQAIFWISK